VRNNKLTILLLLVFVTWVSGVSGQVEDAGGADAVADADAEGGEPWPREFVGDNGGKAIVYQPQLMKWDDFETLQVRVAVAVSLPGQDEPDLGAVEIVAKTDTDLDARVVGVSEMRIETANFPTLDDETSRRLTKALAELLPADGMTISVDRVIAGLEDGQVERERGPLKVDAPPIFVSHEPSILVQFDGEPMMSPIEGTKLEYAINTNWEYFLNQKSSQYFLLLEDAWLTAPGLNGPWESVKKLPKTFKKLPKDDPNFENARAHLKGDELAPSQMPRIFVAEKPAELIVIHGETALEQIDGTGLAWVANSESDLFLAMDEKAYYYLGSGRWFRASALDGVWTFATEDLPEDFAKIPADHPRGYVLASVPGTPEATEAMLLARIPQKAEVDRDGVSVEVEYAGEPEFQTIEGMNLEYAVNTSFDVIKAGSIYYVCHQAVWFRGESPTGPWQVADQVPEEIYAIPPSSPVHNTTYVQVYDYNPTSVTFGYSSGYWNMYIGWGCVMYGSGWYHSPYYYRYPGYGYPIYYPYPYSYGASAWYNPHTGTYGRGASVYGPYGGVGFAASYNPSSGTYARGSVAYGPYNARGFAEAYNPSTGTYARTRQGANVYENWGATSVRRGDDWVRSAHYGNDQGGVKRYRTSQGGSGFVGSGESGLYAGRDGNVYRNDGGGWQKYGGGDWTNVQRPSTGQVRDSRGAGIDRGTYDQLGRDYSGRARGADRSRSYGTWQQGGGRSGGYNRGGARPMPRGGGRRN
jgi:hypothetical protein